MAEAAEQGRGGAEFSKSGIRQVAAMDESGGKVEMLRTPEDVPGNPHARQLSTDDTDGRFLRQAKYANRRDAFSPDEFNRRYHGNAAGNSAVTLELTQSIDNEDTDFGKEVRNQ